MSADGSGSGPSGLTGHGLKGGIVDARAVGQAALGQLVLDLLAQLVVLLVRAHHLHAGIGANTQRGRVTAAANWCGVASAVLGPFTLERQGQSGNESTPAPPARPCARPCRAPTAASRPAGSPAQRRAPATRTSVNRMPSLTDVAASDWGARMHLWGRDGGRRASPASSCRPGPCCRGRAPARCWWARPPQRRRAWATVARP